MEIYTRVFPVENISERMLMDAERPEGFHSLKSNTKYSERLEQLFGSLQKGEEKEHRSL